MESDPPPTGTEIITSGWDHGGYCCRVCGLTAPHTIWARLQQEHEARATSAHVLRDQEQTIESQRQRLERLAHDNEESRLWIAEAGEREAHLVEELREVRASNEALMDKVEETQAERLSLRDQLASSGATLPPPRLSDLVTPEGAPVALAERPTVRAEHRCEHCDRPMPCVFHPEGYDPTEAALQAVREARLLIQQLTPEGQATIIRSMLSGLGSSE